MKSFALACSAILASTAYAGPAGPPGPYADEAPKPYVYEYGVEDSYSGAAFGQTETSDTKLVNGNSHQLISPHLHPLPSGQPLPHHTLDKFP